MNCHLLVHLISRTRGVSQLGHVLLGAPSRVPLEGGGENVVEVPDLENQFNG